MSTQLQEICTVCGTLQTFMFAGGDARDDGLCGTCGASLKERDAAHFLLAHAAHGAVTSIKDLAKRQPEVVPTIVECAYNSALSKQMRDHPKYEQRYFWLSGKSERSPAGHDVPFCDLHDTGFEDASKDFIVTNDALSFVQDVRRVLKEMGRVIRRGGAFVSIDKIDWPVPSETVEIEETLQKVYRVPDGTLPLRRKLGTDLARMFAEHGFRLMLRQVGVSNRDKRNFTLIGLRL